MIKRILFITICLISFTAVIGQEEGTSTGVLPSDIPLHNSIKYNRLMFNPTFSFVRENKNSINIYNRNPRASFSDNSQTYFMNYSARFEEKMGVGVGLFQQNIGVFRFFGATLNYAYNVEIDRDMNLTFGMNVNYSQSALKSNLDQAQADDTIINNYQNSSVFLLHPGVNFSWENFDVGVSAGNVVAYNVSSSELLTDSMVLSGHVMYTTNLDLRADNEIRGMAYASKPGEQALRYGGNVIFELPQYGWAQVGYNSNFGAAIGIGANITNNVSLGYTVEPGIGGDAVIAEFGATHEFGLAYNFEEEKRSRRGKKTSSQKAYEQRDSEIRRLKKEILEQNRVIRDLQDQNGSAQSQEQKAMSELERSIAEAKEKEAEAARQLELQREEEVKLLNKEEERLAAQKEVERIEAEQKAEEERLAAQKNIEREVSEQESELTKIAAEEAAREAEAAEQQAEEERLAAQKEVERVEEEKKAEEERLAAQRKLEREVAQKADEEKLRQEAAAEAARLAEEERLRQEAAAEAARLAEEERLRQEAAAEAARLAEEERLRQEAAAEAARLAEEERLRQEAAAEAARLAEEERLRQEAAAEAARLAEEERLRQEAAAEAARLAEEERLRQEAAAEAARLAEEERLRQEAAAEAARLAEEERLRQEAAAEAARLAEEERLRQEAAAEAARLAEEERLRQEAAAEAARLAEEERLRKAAAEAAQIKEEGLEEIQKELDNNSRISNKIFARRDSLLTTSLNVDKREFNKLLESLVNMNDDASQVEANPTSSKQLTANNRFVKFADATRPQAQFATKFIPGYPEGYYLIGNVFKGGIYADKFTEKLKDIGFNDSQIILNPENNFQYVSIESYTDKDEAARKYLSNIDNRYYGEMWILHIAKSRVASYKKLLQETKLITDTVKDDTVLNETLSYIGGHDIKNGYYLITNIFKRENYFERGMAKLKAQGLEPQFFRNPKDNYIYVYLKRFDNLDEAKQSLFSNVNNSYNGDLYILKIQ